MKMIFQVSLCLGLLLACTVVTVHANNVPVSQKEHSVNEQGVLALYETVPDALGDIELVVSDETLIIAERLAAALQQRQPGLIVNLRTFSQTVSEQWWRIAPASKMALFFMPMPRQEIDTFVQARGYDPIELRVAADAIAVVVNQNNPVANRGMERVEIDGLFSETGRRGHLPLRSWGQLGVKNDWQERPIEPVAQMSTTSVSRHFRRLALKGGDYRRDIPRLKSSAQVIRRVSDDASAIGYIARSQLDARVKAVTVSGWDEENNANSVAADDPAVLQNPLAFWLYLYVDQKPGSPLAATTRAFLRFFYSQEGQQLMSDAGYMSVNPEIAADDFNKHGLVWP